MGHDHEAPHPYQEVNAMIAPTCDDVFSPQWVNTHMTHPTHDLVILRHLIPWQSMIDPLLPSYAPHTGRMGRSRRTLVGIAVVARLRQLSDRKVSEAMQANRYVQYFCHVPAPGLLTFLHPPTLCRFRQRLGQEGIEVLEEQVFMHLKRAGALNADMRRMDSSILDSPIISPNDVRLLSKALGTLGQCAKQQRLPLWWDLDTLPSRWRAFKLRTAEKRQAYVTAFSALFVPAWDACRTSATVVAMSEKQRANAVKLLSVLPFLETHTQHKLAGPLHSAHRLVSLDALEARPRKRGTTHPSTACGTTMQMPFNRQGCMIPTETCIGHPHATTLYGSTLEAFRQRMQGAPDTAGTDVGLRSAQNLTLHLKDIDQSCLGRSPEVDADHQAACRSARSATAGCRAVATHLRGFGRSWSRGLHGARLWTRVNQWAYHMKKVLQLYRHEALEDRTLVM